MLSVKAANVANGPPAATSTDTSEPAFTGTEIRRSNDCGNPTDATKAKANRFERVPLVINFLACNDDGRFNA